MNTIEKLTAKVNALNHITMHLMALEISRDDDPIEAAEMLQMRTILATRVQIEKTNDSAKRAQLELMLRELNKTFAELVRYFG